MSHTYSKFTPRLTAVLCLVLLLTFSLGHQPAEAQEPTGATIYLPVVIKEGHTPNPNPSPAGPYAQMLAQIRQRCATTGLNQVCTANGQVTLQPQSGPATITQPGTITDLATIQHLSLTSSGADPQQWSLAWLRLRADSATPDQELTLLVFGTVHISSITLFENQAGQGDEVTLPSLQFASSPVTGVTKQGSSGLIVSNPTDDDLLSLTLNGATITLGSTALVEAQPGSQMTVTMATGSSLTEAKGGSSSAIQNQQVTVPLDEKGQASGSPTPATSLEEDDFLSQMLDDLLQKLIDQKKLAGSVLTRLNRAIDRCTAGQAAYVYNVLYWIRIIEKTPGLKFLTDPEKLAQAYDRAPNCLSFEIDFDSTVTSTTGPLFRSSHVHTEALPVQFLVDGRFIAINSSLDYPNFTFIPPASPCTISKSTTPGELELADGALKIAGNKVTISTSLRVVKEAKDLGMLTCPHTPTPLEWPDNWWIFFFDTHKGLLEGQDFRTFGFNDWRYTATSSVCSGSASPQTCNHFGEAIYEFSGEAESTTFNATTHLVLVHTPQQ